MLELARWHDLTTEDVLEPDLPIIDPHHHFYDVPADYPFKPYLLDAFLKDIGNHNIRQTVFVECGEAYRAHGPEEFRSVGEVEFAEGFAARSASGRLGETRAAAGIVGTANLLLGDRVAPVLEALIAASPSRMRGIRQRVAYRPDRTHGRAPHILLDPNFRRGFGYLQPYGLTFDAWLFPHQLPDLTDLARAFPDTTVILDHLGAPLGEGRDLDEVFAEWKPVMTEVATCPNVYLKVGGLGMTSCGFGWHTRPQPPTSDELLEQNRRWYAFAIDAFGPTRCMFESNFPVDGMSYSYAILWNQFKKLTRGFRTDERAAMFHDNARRVYRLPREWATL